MRPIVFWSGLALVAGLLLGVGGRAVMRLLAVVAGGRQGFSMGGSAEVVATGLIIGTPLALVAFLLQSLRPKVAFLAACGVSMLAFGALCIVPTPAAQSALAATPVPGSVVALHFGGLFAAFGALLYVLWRLGPRPSAH